MIESTFSEYWAQAQFCYFKAEKARGPASKHLWIHMAQDWIALSEGLMDQSDRQNEFSPQERDEPLERMEPFLVA